MLNSYAVEVRYPGETATKEDAKKIIRILNRFRKEFRSLLNLN